MNRFGHPERVGRRVPRNVLGALTSISVIGTALAVSTACGWGAEAGTRGPSAVTFLTELILLMLVGRLLGELMIRCP
jgi:hypothetical protein